MKYVAILPLVVACVIAGCVSKSPHIVTVLPPPRPQQHLPVTHKKETNTVSNIKHYPLPYFSQDDQPNCLAAALSILASELLRTNLNGKTYWEPQLNVDTKGYAPLSKGIEAWNKTFPSNTLQKIFSDVELITKTNVTLQLQENYPYLWCGLSLSGNGHAAVAYFTANDVELLHIFTHPQTNTNYTEHLDYTNFLERTWLIINVKTNNLPLYNP